MFSIVFDLKISLFSWDSRERCKFDLFRSAVMRSSETGNFFELFSFFVNWFLRIGDNRKERKRNGKIIHQLSRIRIRNVFPCSPAMHRLHCVTWYMEFLLKFMSWTELFFFVCGYSKFMNAFAKKIWKFKIFHFYGFIIKIFNHTERSRKEEKKILKLSPMSQGKIIKCKFLIALLLYQLIDAFKEINHSLIYFFFPLEIEKHSVKHPELWDLLCVVHLDCCFAACSEKIEGKCM